ncbi:type IV toxin-antitoxin system AbiEi family antitoxin domain-containing protein [Micromonospora sp. NPDC049523]|uniref:type IV toxin-antitoxin system AbiEi family antitoxin domain-containing protein n=1 Tax=Micromonospora sp. NPDC049523 TaxID=3155921 RepID=UPI0034231FF7
MAARQDGVVTREQALAAGLTVREIDRLCRGGRWRRLARAAYLVEVAPSPLAARRARIRAAVASFGELATAVLGTAAELHGLAGLRTDPRIHVSVPGPAARPLRPRDPAVVVHQLVTPPEQVGTIGGIRTTTAARTAADLLLRVDRFSAVSMLDSALHQGAITEPDLLVVRAMLARRRGAVSARHHLGQADGRAESPLETRVRLRCVDGGVAPDELQHPVRDEDGYLLAVGDLAWLRERIIGEADGAAVHATPEALYRDRRRQNLIANAGWRVLRFTWSDTLDPDYIPTTIRAARLTHPSRRS